MKNQLANLPTRQLNKKHMKWFSLNKELAMDLGTANTIIISDGRIVVDEPSVVALDRRSERMIAVGDRAKMMYEKTNPEIQTIRPCVTV